MSRTMTQNSAGRSRCLMAVKLSAEVGTTAMAQIDKEITPLIAELATLGSRNNKHPTARQLYNWLVDPNRSAEEFTYVIGPLEKHVYGIMMEHFKSYISISFRRGRKLVGKIAAEALAKRCSVLQGEWETAGWFVGRLNMKYNNYSRVNHGFASKRLSEWIIQTIGDSERCPNSYLRIELIHLLIKMVKIDKSNHNEVLNSVMSAFSSINIYYFIGDKESGFFNMNFNTIFDTLYLFASDDTEHLYVCMDEFDRKVAQKLQNILNIRLSLMINDVAYSHSANPSRYSEPWELASLTALLKTVHGQINLEWEHFKDEGIYDSQWANLESLSRAVSTLIFCFINSFETPQLNEITVLCVIDLLELVVLSNIAVYDDRRELYHTTLRYTDQVLEQLIDFENSILTPLGRKVISYDKRLRILRVKWIFFNYSIDSPYRIISLLFKLVS